MLNRTMIALGVAFTASTSLGATTFINSLGNDLYVTTISGGGAVNTTVHTLSADITSLAVNQATGEIYGSANTDSNNNGTFELYRLDDVMGTPSLSLVGDFLAENTPSLSFIGNTLYGVQQPGGGVVNGALVTIDLGAMTQSTVDADLGARHESTGYDPATDTLYANSRGNSSEAALWTVPYGDADVVSQQVGLTGQQAINNGGEFFGGTYYQAVNLPGGNVLIGSINTATGEFTTVIDLGTASNAPLGLAVIPAPGAAVCFAGLGLAGLRRRR